MEPVGSRKLYAGGDKPLPYDLRILRGANRQSGTHQKSGSTLYQCIQVIIINFIVDCCLAYP